MIKTYSLWKIQWNCSLQNCSHFVQISIYYLCKSGESVVCVLQHEARNWWIYCEGTILYLTNCTINVSVSVRILGAIPVYMTLENPTSAEKRHLTAWSSIKYLEADSFATENITWLVVEIFSRWNIQLQWLIWLSIFSYKTVVVYGVKNVAGICWFW